MSEAQFKLIINLFYVTIRIIVKLADVVISVNSGKDTENAFDELDILAKMADDYIEQGRNM